MNESIYLACIYHSFITSILGYFSLTFNVSSTVQLGEDFNFIFLWGGKLNISLWGVLPSLTALANWFAWFAVFACFAFIQQITYGT